MSTRTKFLLFTVVCFVTLALAEQLTKGHFYYSYLTSTTRTEDKRIAQPAELSSTVQVARPFTRWLPFIKRGETVHIHTYQSGDPAKAVFEREATTRTKLLVVGLCSTERFDLLANAPFEKVQKDFLRETDQPNLVRYGDSD